MYGGVTNATLTSATVGATGSFLYEGDHVAAIAVLGLGFVFMAAAVGRATIRRRPHEL